MRNEVSDEEKRMAAVCILAGVVVLITVFWFVQG